MSREDAFNIPDYKFIVTQMFYIDDEVTHGEHKFQNGELFCRDMLGNWYIHNKPGLPIHYVQDAMIRLTHLDNPLALHKGHWKLFAGAAEDVQDHHLAVFRHSKVEIMARRNYAPVPS